MTPPDIQLSLYQLLGIVFTIIGAFWAVITLFGKALVKQFDAGIEAKFAALNESRRTEKAAWEGRHDRSEKTAADINARLIKVEADMAHMPSTEQLGQLNGRIERLQGETNTQTELLKRMENQMRLINEWMIENK